MPSVLKTLEAPIPRPLLCVGVPVSALFLIIFFVFMTFPYESIARLLLPSVGQSNQGDIAVGAIEPTFGLLGPGFTAVDLRLAFEKDPPIIIDRLAIRPAWSLDWFRGRAVLGVEIESFVANSQSIITLSSKGGLEKWSGEIVVEELAEIPFPRPEGFSLDGTVSASGELQFGEGSSMSGPIRFEAEDGSLSLSAIPIPLEFNTLKGNLAFGGGALVKILELELAGPILAASAQGVVREGAAPNGHPIDIDVQVSIENPVLKTMVQGMGIRLDGTGRASLKLSGTLQNPRIN